MYLLFHEIFNKYTSNQVMKILHNGVVHTSDLCKLYGTIMK